MPRHFQRSLLTQPTRRRQARTCLLAVVVLALLGACAPPPSPAERLNESAHLLNTATRFGRMDVAVSLVAPEEQLSFAARRRSWGRNVRILEVDMAGMRTLGVDMVEVRVGVTWHRIDQMEIRQTVVGQRWRVSREDWLLMEEGRVAGAPGLFNALPKPAKEPESAAQLADPS